MMMLCPNWVKLRVDDKTWMMNYEGDLVSLVIHIIYFKLWLIVIKSWCCKGVCLVLGLIGWYVIELKCLDYDLWGVGLRCICYKNGGWLPMCLSMKWYVNVLTSIIWILMKDDTHAIPIEIWWWWCYTRVRPYDLH